MALFEFPKVDFTAKNSVVIPSVAFPLDTSFYHFLPTYLDGEIRTLRDVEEEVKELIRRYAILFPETIMPIETEHYIQYRCLVNDEETGITRGILERLGYTLLESDYEPYGVYWIELKTRGELRRQR